MLSSYHWQITTHRCITMSWIMFSVLSHHSALCVAGFQPSAAGPWLPSLSSANQWWFWWRNSIKIEQREAQFGQIFRCFGWWFCLSSQIQGWEKRHFLQAGLLKAQLYELKILGSGDRHLLSPGFRHIISFYVRCFSHQMHFLEALWIPRVLVASGNNKLRMKKPVPPKSLWMI